MEFDNRLVEYEDSSIEIMERLLLKGYVGPEHVEFCKVLMECIGQQNGLSTEEIRKLTVREAMSLEPEVFTGVNSRTLSAETSPDSSPIVRVNAPSSCR